MTARATGTGGWLRSLGLHRPELRAWAMYDWANSSFATTIMTAVLPIYFVRVAAAGLTPNTAGAYWGYAAGLGMLLITLASPVLGTIADYLGAQKRFLAAFAFVGAGATAALWFVGRGDWVLAIVLFTIGNLGFMGSIVYYDALLPHIASPGEIDRVSSAGWAVGYVGGGILLVFNTLVIARPGLFHLPDAVVASRVAFVTVAVWWTVFTIPLLRGVREPPRQLEAGASPPVAVIRAGFTRLAETLRRVRRYPDLARFLIAFWLYADGIGTIMKMATVYATEIGIGQNALLGALVVTQFVGIPFTLLFGGLAGRIGARNGIYIGLVAYLLITIGAYFVREAWHFWALAIAVSTVVGGTQALSRSLYATMIPMSRSAEFFSFYGVFDKFSGIFGPLVFAVVGQLTGTGRLGIVAVGLFFVLGMVLLSGVDVEAGRRAALEEERNLGPLEPVRTLPDAV